MSCFSFFFLSGDDGGMGEFLGGDCFDMQKE